MHSGLVEVVWFLWDCLWDSGGLQVTSQRLAEDGVLGARDDAVVGVACPLPSALAWMMLVKQFRL